MDTVERGIVGHDWARLGIVKLGRTWFDKVQHGRKRLKTAEHDRPVTRLNAVRNIV